AWHLHSGDALQPARVARAAAANGHRTGVRRLPLRPGTDLREPGRLAGRGRPAHQQNRTRRSANPGKLCRLGSTREVPRTSLEVHGEERDWTAPMRSVTHGPCDLFTW